MKDKIKKKEALEAKVHYDLVATQYASTDNAVNNLPSRRVRELSLSHSFGNVLDIGCGTGRYFPFVHGNGRFVGLDISPKMLDIARQRSTILLKNGFNKVDYIESDVYEINRRRIEIEFDFIYSIGTIGYHIPFDVEIAQIIQSLLSQNGLCLIQTVQDRRLNKIKKSINRILVVHDIKRGSVLSGYSTTPNLVRSVARRTGLNTISLEFEPDNWNNLPMILSLFEKQVDKEILMLGE